MDCSTPLSDEQIHELLEGNASEDVKRHAEECVTCARRVQQAGSIMPTLSFLLFRAECPSSDQLRNYHFEILDAEQTAALDKHLTICRRCQQELSELTAFLAGETAPTAKPQQSDLDPRRPNFIFATPVAGERLALRGIAPEPLMFEAETATVFLELEPVPQGFLLRGQVLDAERLDLWSEALIEVWQDGSLLGKVRADDMGAFDYVLEEPGKIDLRAIAQHGPNLIISDIEYEE